jgi:penicillin-insensitive murein endopeptidase
VASAGQPDGDLELSQVGPLVEAPGGASVRTPSQEGLRLLIQLDPTALGPLSIGSPNAGLLFNPRPMPEGRLWKIRNPRETYGTTETIEYVITAIEGVERQFPGSPPIVIGDISNPDGGRLNWHASHQVGRDVDIGFYHTREVDDLLLARKDNLDIPRTWALVRALVTETDVDRIFMDRYIQRYLFAYALEIGEDRDWLDDIFGRKTAGKDAIIQHVRRHRDHMHVRFYNPRAQEWGRVAYPLLVKAQLAPGPTVTHRVRQGETLSHLSRRYGTSTRAIRQANGLRSSLIRAGRRYVIPVRKIPSEAEPVVVPPRRLPPASQAVASDLPEIPEAPPAVESEDSAPEADLPLGSVAG